jgi:hypothetical protein
LSPASTVLLCKRHATGALLHNVSAMLQRTAAEMSFGSQAYKAYELESDVIIIIDVIVVITFLCPCLVQEVWCVCG